MPYNEEKHVSLGPWPGGMNNRQPDYALPPGTMRNAVNVDVDETGRVRRRAGYTRVAAALGARAGYSCPLGAFFIHGATLAELHDDGTYTNLFTGFYGDEIAYHYFDGTMYISDGVMSKRLTSAGLLDWGRAVPPTPLVSVTAGSLPAGSYTVAVSEVTSDGLEHGLSDTVSITTSASGGIIVTGLNPAVTSRVYMSTTNGTVLFMAAEVTGGVATVSAPGYDNDKPADTQFMVPPPPGRIIRWFNGRLYIAAGNVVWYTEPYLPHLVNVTSGFLVFDEPVTVLEPVDNGIWIVSSVTEFYAGTGPDDFKPSEKLGYGAAWGSGVYDLATKKAMWYSSRGVVVGDGSGSITNVQEKNVAADSGTIAAAILREQDGLRQFVASVKDPTVSPLASSTFIEMEVIRKA